MSKTTRKITKTQLGRRTLPRHSRNRALLPGTKLLPRRVVPPVAKHIGWRRSLDFAILTYNKEPDRASRGNKKGLHSDTLIAVVPSRLIRTGTRLISRLCAGISFDVRQENALNTIKSKCQTKAIPPPPKRTCPKRRGRNFILLLWKGFLQDFFRNPSSLSFPSFILSWVFFTHASATHWPEGTQRCCFPLSLSFLLYIFF